jgi:uncharacterized repeat protein (TIGR01451 family)
VITTDDTAFDNISISQVAPDLVIACTHSGPFRQGDNSTTDTYTLVVSNSGNAATTTGAVVTVTDILPPGITVTNMTGTGWTFNQSAVTATRSDSLGVGLSYQFITITVNVAPNAASVLTNQATVSGGGEQNTTNDSVSDVTMITVVAPDLVVLSTHSGNFKQGDTADTYTLKVTNVGTSPTSGPVTITDLLPPGMSAVSLVETGTGANWTIDPSHLSATRSDPLPAGQYYSTLTLTVSVTPTAGPSLINTVSVSGGGEQNTANDVNYDSTTVSPVAPDLTLVCNHVGSFKQGDTSGFVTVIVTNSGNVAISSTSAINLAAVIPAGLTPTSISGTGWTTDLPTLTATRSGPLNPGASFPALNIAVTVAANAPSRVITSATVSGGGEQNTSNDFASDTILIAPVAPDLIITTTHAGISRQGATGGAYAFKITNNGTAPTSGPVTFTDLLPPGFTVVDFAGTNWNCDKTHLTATRTDALDPGKTYDALAITVNVPATAPTYVTNVATISGGNEQNTINDTSYDVAYIAPSGPQLKITATDDSKTQAFQQGDLLHTLTIAVTNLGENDTSGQVIVTDVLPPGLTPVGTTPMVGSNWIINQGALTATRTDPLPYGHSYDKLTIAVSVDPNAPSNVVNTATVSGGGDINAAQNPSYDPISIAPSAPDLVISEVHPTTEVFNQGDTGKTFQITVSNIGTTDTNGPVIVNVTLPPGLTPNSTTPLSSTDSLWTFNQSTLTATRSESLN